MQERKDVQKVKMLLLTIVSWPKTIVQAIPTLAGIARWMREAKEIKYIIFLNINSTYGKMLKYEPINKAFQS